MSRIFLVVLFWVTLVVALITMTVPQMKGGVWEGVTGFFQECLANDMQKRDMAFRKKKKLVKSYVQMIKELYGTRFLMAEDAADLAEKYSKVVQSAKEANVGTSHAMINNHVNELNSQAGSLRKLHGREALELTDAMISRFRNLEQKLKEQPSGREDYQEQIEKLAALKDRYASTLERVSSQREKVREMDDKIRSLNERMRTVDRMNSDAKERLASMQERLASRTEAAQELFHSAQEDMDTMKARQAEQKARMDILLERTNARMGR
jgi:phage regulator Rha-like protein